MTHAIDVLRQEHRSMSRLLRLMDQLQGEMRDGQQPDIPLLSEIGAYLRGFPDQCHHPKEDLIYARLAELEPGLRDLGSDLGYEHRRLANLTDRFTGDVDALQRDPGGDIDNLVGSLEDLAKSYRRHMEMEERHLFPMALRKLRRTDWKAINSALFDQADPLEDESQAAFAALRRAIGEQAAAHDERNRLLAGRSAVETDLATLRELAELNELVSAHGYELCEQQPPARGFALLEHGVTVLEIPPCSEQRAVWCAWCYVRGRV